MFQGREIKVWAAGIGATVLATAILTGGAGIIEWYNFKVEIKLWQPTVEKRLEMLEIRQDQKFDKILSELDNMKRAQQRQRDRDREK